MFKSRNSNGRIISWYSPQIKAIKERNQKEEPREELSVSL